MKQALAIILMVCILISLFPMTGFAEESVQLEQRAMSTQDGSLDAEDYEASDEIWEKIRQKENELSAKKATQKQKVAAIISAIESSENYLEGSLILTSSSITWKTVQGIACRYQLEDVDCDRGESEGNPILPTDEEYEFISYAKKGAPAGQDVYLIGPYYTIDSDFTDHYKTLAKSIASTTGGTYTLYATTKATIDNVADAISNGAIVLIDSHGTYDSSAKKSYLRLTTSTGLTTSDYNNGYVYETWSSEFSRYLYMVTGDAIAAHMKKDAPNNFVWYGTCSGMRYDTMCMPVINRGVAACLGYSRTVSFEYDREWVSAFCNALMSGQDVAAAANTMKNKVGKWDRCDETAFNTLEKAISNAKAFPIIVSNADDYPNDVEGLQTVYSDWSLSACNHSSVSYVADVPAGCISTGNTAHYQCDHCTVRFTTSACTTRLSKSDITIAALGHSISSGVCSRCGYQSGTTLWHFWEHRSESDYRWVAENFKSGTVTRADGSDRGVLYSTTDGDDHYVYMKLGTGSVGHTVASGDVIEIRYKTVGLPASKVGTNGSFDLWYTTTSSDSSFSSSMKLSATVTRKENQWQTVSFTPTAGITLKRLMMDVLEEDNGYSGTRFEVDYVYFGPAANAPSKRTEKSIFIDFKNDAAAEDRYVNEVYGDINFDTNGWKGNSGCVSTLSYQEDSLLFTLTDQADVAYIQTVDGANGMNATPLNYTPKAGDIVQMRMKLENIQAIDGQTPYLRMYYIKNNATSGVSLSDFTEIKSLTSEDMNGTYVTYTAQLDTTFTGASVINALRPQIGNIAAVSGMTGKVTIDYIYVGPTSELPSEIGHTHEYDANGICTICGVGHIHDFSGDPISTARAASCSVPGSAIKRCADCGELAYVSIAKTAHTLSNNVCTVCGYVNGGYLLHFAANTPSASYTWNTYDGTTTVTTTGTGILSTKLNSSVSDHYLTMNEEVAYKVRSGDVIEIKFRCNKARTSAQTFEVRYTTAASQESFSSATSLTKSVSFAANTWTTVQFTPTVGQTVYRLFLEPFLNDDSSFAGKTVDIDYIYVGPANGAPSKAKTTAPLYFDFTNDTLAQHRFVSSTYGYMQTIESDLDHWVVNANRATKEMTNGALVLTVQSLGAPYAQIANAAGSTAYANAPLSYKLDGTDYVQICVKFDNCLAQSATPYIAFNYMTDKTVEHENPSDQTTYNYGATVHVNPEYLVDGQYHIYTIPLSSELTVGENLVNFRLGFGNVVAANAGNSTICIEYIAVGAKSELPLADVYTVKFVDESGKTLRTQNVAKGEMPYCATAPTKSADNASHYIFTGWDSALTAAVADTTYTAQFSAQQHTLTDGVVTAPTCSADGYTTYTCSVCAMKVVSDYVTGAHKETLVNAKAASCTQDGYTGDTVCENCGLTIASGATIAKTGHRYDDGMVAIEPTCTEEGVRRYSCENCSHSYTQTIAATGHITTIIVTLEPTCTQEGSAMIVCDVCGITVETQIIAARGHSYQDTVTKATCTTGGYTTHVCMICGHSQVDSYVAALGHAYEQTVTAPTCTQDGYTTHLCTTCGESYVDSYTAAISHSYAYQDCANGTHVVTCAYGCDYRATEDCTYIDKICICGAVKICEHADTDVVPTLEPTCTVNGSGIVVCRDCNETIGITEIEKLGHSIVTVAAKAATCEADGCRAHWYCAQCDTGFADELGEYPLPSSFFAIAATGHSVTYVAEQAPTCTESGYARHYECTACGKYFFDEQCEYEAPADHIVIAPTGHCYVDGICANCGTAPKYQYSDKLATSMGITVGAETQVSYTILNARIKDYESFYVEIVKEVAGGESITTTYSLDANNLTDMLNPNTGAHVGYYAIYTGIKASQMGDEFSATLYAVAEDGTIYYGPANTGSIKSFLYEKIAAEAALPELKTLAVDMLNYGAAAQVYFGYDAENLVNADLTEEQKLLGTQEIPAAVDTSGSTGDGGMIIPNVTLESKVVLYVNCRYAATDTSNLVVVIKDMNGNVINEVIPKILTAKICQAAYSNVGAKQMRQPIRIEMYDNGTMVTQTLTWSIESYVAQTRANTNASEALLSAVNAMLTYGDSAAAYLTASGQ